MGLGSGSSGTALPPHHGHHAHHHGGSGGYLLNGHEKEFKGLNAFEKYKSGASPYGKLHGGSHHHQQEMASDDEDERVDIMDDDDDDALTSNSSSANGHHPHHPQHQSQQQHHHHHLNSHPSAADFHHKLFANFDAANKQTSADGKNKPGKQARTKHRLG